MRNKTLPLVRCALFVAAMAVCAWICLPLSVSFTLQVLALFLAAGVLGVGECFASCLVYLALGAVGLPVFAGFQGGVGVLLGATGGFLLSFPLVAPLTALLLGRFGKSLVGRFLWMLPGLFLLYIGGVLWFSLVYTQGASSLWGAALALVLPFLLPDLLKLFAAAFLSLRLKKNGALGL